MTGRAFVDTNVLVYAQDHADTRKQQVAGDVLRAFAGRLVLSTQVLAEYFVVVTRRLAVPLSEADAAESVEQLAKHTVVAVDRELVRDAIEISREGRTSYWDAQIVAAARAAGCETILTEDLQHGSAIAGVRIENPFAPAG